MSIPREKKEELASAYLDGVLEPQERLEVERFLREDAEFASIFADLISIREAIRSIPPQKLTKEFANRVVQAARRDAAQLGPKAPHWINPPEKRHNPLRKEGPQPAELVNEPRRSKVWGVLAALAATMLLALTATVYKQYAKKETPANSFVQIPHSRESTEESKNRDVDFDSPKQDSVIAQSDSHISPTDSLPSTGGDGADRMEVTNIAQADPAKLSSEGNDNVKRMEIVQADGLSQDTIPKLEIPGLKIDELMFLVDLSVSEEALAGNFLEQILERHQIAFDAPLSVGEEVHQALKANRFVSSEPTPSSGTVTVVFVKCRGSRLDAALSEIFGFYEDFPEISFDLIVDPPAPEGLQLLRSLREFNEAEFANSDSQFAGLARPFRLTEDSFVAPARRPSIPREVRALGFTSLSESVDMDPVTYAVIVVRHPNP